MAFQDNAFQNDTIFTAAGFQVSLVALGPAPAGTVPIRYVLGVTENVVPVETVTVWDFGVVPAREEVGPANVVPVREAIGETPRVRIILV